MSPYGRWQNQHLHVANANKKKSGCSHSGQITIHTTVTVHFQRLVRRYTCITCFAEMQLTQPKSKATYLHYFTSIVSNACPVQVPTGLQADAQSIDIVQQLCTGLDDQREKILVLTAWVVYQQLTAVLLTRDDCCKRLFALCR